MSKISWPTAIWFALIHVGAVVACFMFSWSGFAHMIALIVITIVFGVGVGYHRLHTHSSYKTYPWMRVTLAFIGGLSGEGSVIQWVAYHHKHHKHSDTAEDPHSPRKGFWWSHILWMIQREPNVEKILKHAGKLRDEPAMVFLHKTFLLWHFLLGALLFGTGWLVGGWQLAVSWLAWGMFFRMVVVLHITWCVNSATHKWGYKRYETDDESRNLWWVALLSGGEGWHNNHHAYPWCARHGHKWWEVDVNYYVIWLMEKIGLAWKVRRLPS